MQVAGYGSVAKLIDLALEEDIGCGDITTDALIAPTQMGRGRIRAREPLVLAGLPVARRVFRRLDPDVRFNAAATDGDRLQADGSVLEATGRMGALLTAERTALNFLQRLSGIATHVRRFVDALGDAPARLVDTRKTTPGWRELEKYAVRVGGAGNHRSGLHDGVLIKDNHIAACGGVAAAVSRARQRASHLIRIEVEAASMDQVDEALAAGADAILLDNMGTAQIRAAVDRIGDRALIEVSGGVTLDRLPLLARTGVQIISAGVLTHGAVAVDLSMDIEPMRGREPAADPNASDPDR